MWEKESIKFIGIATVWCYYFLIFSSVAWTHVLFCLNGARELLGRNISNSMIERDANSKVIYLLLRSLKKEDCVQHFF